MAGAIDFVHDTTYNLWKLTRSTGMLHEIRVHVLHIVLTNLGHHHHLLHHLLNTGKAAWIAGTTFIVLVVPLIIEMDREQQLVDFEKQQLNALTGPSTAS